jgi:lysophospholipase L1-like esterase
MRILMLGNSFTFANNMPQMLANLTGAEVVHHTRGGARLAEQINPKTKMGVKTLAALKSEKWDYVILQEMSNAPITSKESFLNNVSLLCDKIRDIGAVPVLYATWAYQKGGKKLESFGMDYDEMYRKLYDAYHEAADKTRALIADVGKRFYEIADQYDIYADDGCHPNELGSQTAARVIAEVIMDKM